MKRLLLLISLVTLFVSIPLIAAADEPVCPSPAVFSAEEVCDCRLDFPGAWWGEYKNFGDCVSEVNACNQADVPAVCECKYAQRMDKYKGGPFCFRNLGQCVSYLASMGYAGGALPPCP